MKITLSPQAATASGADLLVFTLPPHWKADEIARLDRLLKGTLIATTTQQGFHGNEGDVAVYQTHGALRARNVLLVGVGNTQGVAAWQRAAQAVVTRAQELRATSAAIVCGPTIKPANLQTLAEALRLSSYSFDQLKSSPDSRRVRLHSVALLAPASAEARRAVSRGDTIGTATCYARDLINLPAGHVTPTYLAQEARRLARSGGLKARILDGAAIKRAGMGALAGVAMGSSQPARFIELVYQPKSKATRVVALCGKGITFDSGGLSLKPAESMQSQKRDMAGGGVVLAVMSALRALNVGVEVRGYVPATENMPDGLAIKPGDVLRAYNGKTIEVLNTDAEGRLVLADALSFAAAGKPDVMIDLATLTAAVRAALGPRYAAIMGTNATLVQDLIGAGRECGENLWELPLVEEYRSDIVSSVADIKNTGEGSAGTIIGGLFLKEFVGKVPWAHIDFSSTVVSDKPLPCHPRGATGFGVRTLLQYLMNG